MLALRGHNDLLVDHLMVLFLLCFCVTSVILSCPPSLQILVQLPFLLFFSTFRGSLCVSPWIFPLFAFSLSYFLQQFHLKQKQKQKNLQPLYLFRGLPGSAVVKNLPANAEDAKAQVQSVGREDPLEEEMATCSSILAWKNYTDRGSWQVTVQGVSKSWT